MNRTNDIIAAEVDTMEYAIVAMNDGRFGLIVRDTEAELTLPTAHIFPTEARALAAWNDTVEKARACAI